MVTRYCVTLLWLFCIITGLESGRTFRSYKNVHHGGNSCRFEPSNVNFNQKNRVLVRWRHIQSPGVPTRQTFSKERLALSDWLFELYICLLCVLGCNTCSSSSKLYLRNLHRVSGPVWLRPRTGWSMLILGLKTKTTKFEIKNEMLPVVFIWHDKRYFHTGEKETEIC